MASPLVSVLAVSIAEDMNPSCRRAMEDAHVTVDQYAGHPRQGYFAVYDGHGGRGVVEFIERQLHLNLETELDEAKQSRRSVEECMKSAYLLTDIQTKEANLVMDGSTAVSCFIEVVESEGSAGSKGEGSDEEVRILHTANCGDARAVLARGNEAIRLTFDHKASDPGEQKRIEASQGFVLRGRVLGILAVSRSFGDHALKQFVPALPFYRKDRLVSDDRFLIVACDGVWDVMTDQEAVDFVDKRIDEALAAGESMPDNPFRNFELSVAQALVDEALERQSKDNITVQIVLLRR
jgi:serine/threonine protein phosphatase PrpC